MKALCFNSSYKEQEQKKPLRSVASQAVQLSSWKSQEELGIEKNT